MDLLGLATGAGAKLFGQVLIEIHSDKCFFEWTGALNNLDN